MFLIYHLKKRVYNYFSHASVPIIFEHGKFAADNTDMVICCETNASGTHVFSAGSSGVVRVWQRREMRANTSKESEITSDNGTQSTSPLRRQRLSMSVSPAKVSGEFLISEKERVTKYVLSDVLLGHSKQVSCMHVSDSFGLLVTGSEDKSVIVWDLHKLFYVRSLSTKGPVSVVRVSNVNGDVACVVHAERTKISEEKHYSTASGGPSRRRMSKSPFKKLSKHSIVTIWNINGSHSKEAVVQHQQISTIEFSHGTEGIERNLLLAGTADGEILFFDAFDLTLLHTIDTGLDCSIHSILIEPGNTWFLSSDDQGRICHFFIPKKKGSSSLFAQSWTKKASAPLILNNK